MRLTAGNAKKKRNKQYHSNTRGTVQGLVNPPRHSGKANFSKILPGTMNKLVEEGLFVPDGVNDLGQKKYKITALGMKKLKELD